MTRLIRVVANTSNSTITGMKITILYSVVRTHNNTHTQHPLSRRIPGVRVRYHRRPHCLFDDSNHVDNTSCVHYYISRCTHGHGVLLRIQVTAKHPVR